MRTLPLISLIALVACGPVDLSELDDTGTDECTENCNDADPDNGGANDPEPDDECPSGNESDCDGDGYAAEVDGEVFDCDDLDADRNPGADEICDDGIDNDCDGYGDGADNECETEDDFVDNDGDGVSADIDCDDENPEVWREEDCEDDGGDTDPPEDDWSDYIIADGDDVCFAVTGMQSSYQSADAFLMSNQITWSALDSYRASASGGYYCFDTSGWEQRTYDATIVTATATNGGTTTSYADTADWWDNFDFCESGSDTASDWCTVTGSSGGLNNYLVQFAVTSDGVVPAGDI